MEIDNKVFTAVEVAEYLHCHIEQIRKMTRRGELPHYNIGRRILYRKSVIDKWIEEQEARSCGEWI